MDGQRMEILEAEEKMLDELQAADLILIGVGEEFDLEKSLKSLPDYEKEKSALEKAGKAWAIPAWNRFCLEEGAEEHSVHKDAGGCASRQALERLAGLVEGKNYFLISVSANDLVRECGFRQDRVVTPCGGILRKQCGAHRECKEGKVAWLDDGERRLLWECCRKRDWDALDFGVCPVCKSPMVLNNVYTEQYDESGYLEQWNLYTKWLQGTLKRKLCILELGVGLSCPGVIRFPFEKIGFFHQRASFFRVNGHLYQLTEGLKDRGVSVPENAVDFLLRLPLSHSCDKL